MFKYLNESLKAIFVFTIITGFIYPLLITAIAQFFFKDKANGSLVIIKGNIIGSVLIGQKFDNDKYFFSRPSSIDYNAFPSGGSNLGPTNKVLQKILLERKQGFKQKNFLKEAVLVPNEMLFSSASGVDPHISVKAAFLQVSRICNSRNFNTIQKKKLINLIADKTEPPQFGFLGEEKINVLLLNIEVDKIR